MSDDLFSIVIIKNIDNNMEKLIRKQLNKLRDTINSFPNSPDGAIIKLAFANAMIDALSQVDIPKTVDGK